jgi:hypothetical protein
MKRTDEIRAKLSGFEVRQLIRDAARRQSGILHKAYSFRKAGRFDVFEDAIKLVEAEFGWESNLETYYGVKMLHLQCGMTLCYDPEGTLSWASAPRSNRNPENGQYEMEFIDESEGACLSASEPHSQP